MAADETPPEDLADFLHWFRERTEGAWAVHETGRLADFEARGAGGSSWRTGTRWRPGLAESEIDQIERDLGFTFPPDFRLYLSILNTTDRGTFTTRFVGNKLMEVPDHRPFADWRDTTDIRARLLHLLEGILFDVRNDNWYPGWGNRPAETEDAVGLVSTMIAEAPPLLPIFSHRFMPSAPCIAGLPILSVHQSDAIVYGANLRDYLMEEFAALIGLKRTLPKNEITFEPADLPFWGALFKDPE